MKLPRRRVVLSWILGAILVGGAIAWFLLTPSGPPPGSAIIRLAALKEASGLAASRRTPGVLWAQNDSGGEPALYGFVVDGAPKGSIRVADVKNIDWEAIASFELDGRSYLAIGDVGDNSASRRECFIYVIEEPDASQLSPAREAVVPVAWTLRFRYETGPRDCEAMFVDARRQEIVLISKRNAPPHVYALPLRAPSKPGALLTAKKIGVLTHLPHRGSWRRILPVPGARFRAEPTDASIAPDGESVVVLTYGDVLIYARRPGQNWAEAFSRQPTLLHPHGIFQAEGVCFSYDGKSIFVTGEQRDPPLLRYDVPGDTRY